MATRLGNYVTVPGSGANWASGISDSLANLSKSYITQGQAEDERTRLAAADAESKRRWDIANARADAAELEKQKEREGKAAANQFMWNIANKPASYTIEEQTPENQKIINEALGRFESEGKAVTDFLSGKGSLADATKIIRRNIENSGLAEPERNKAIAQQESNLLGMKDQLDFTDLTDEQKATQIAELGQKYYGNRVQELKDKIASGVLMTTEDRVDALMRRVPSDIKDKVDPIALKESLSKVAGGTSKAVLDATEAASVKAANETALKNIELYDKYVGRALSSNNSYSKDAKGIESALKDMGAIDIGWMDNADAKKGFTRLLDEFTPSQAAAIVKFGIDKGLVEDSFPSVDSKEFTNLMIEGRKLVSSSKNSGGSQIPRGALSSFNRDQYKYTPQTARSAADILRSRLLLTPQDRLAPNSEFAITVRNPYQGAPITPNSKPNNTGGNVNPNSTNTAVNTTVSKSIDPNLNPNIRILADELRKRDPSLSVDQSLINAIAQDQRYDSNGKWVPFYQRQAPSIYGRSAPRLPETTRPNAVFGGMTPTQAAVQGRMRAEDYKQLKKLELDTSSKGQAAAQQARKDFIEKYGPNSLR